METGSARVLVLPRPGGGWELRETQTGPVLARTGTRTEAVSRATLMLERRGGGRILTSGSGTDLEELVVAPAVRRPWWYQPSALLRWLFVPLVGLQLGWRVLDPPARPGEIAYTAVLLAATVFFVASAVASTRLDRSRRPRSAPPEETVQD